MASGLFGEDNSISMDDDCLLKSKNTGNNEAMDVVFDNELLVEKILSNLTCKQLIRLTIICKNWYEIINRILKKRLDIKIWFYAYQSQINKTHVFHKTIVDEDPEPNNLEIFSNFTNFLDCVRLSADELWCKPDFAVIIYGGFGSNCPGSKRLINALEQSFYHNLPNQCKIICVESSAGIIGQLKTYPYPKGSDNNKPGDNCDAIIKEELNLEKNEENTATNDQSGHNKSNKSNDNQSNSCSNKNKNNFFDCVELQAGYTRLTGITCLFMPNCNPFGGIGIKFFNETDKLTEFLPTSTDLKYRNKLKCLLLFFTEFDHLTNVHNVIHAYEGKLAVGGGVVESIRDFRTKQETFIQMEKQAQQMRSDDSGKSQADRSGKSRRLARSNSFNYQTKVNGIAIYGDSVKTASFLVTANDAKEFEENLIHFKSTLDFNVDTVDDNYETYAYLFICNGRGTSVYGKSNVESNMIRKHFKFAKVFGIYGYGEYGYNYFPRENLDVNVRKKFDLWENDEESWMHSFTSVIVLVHFHRFGN